MQKVIIEYEIALVILKCVSNTVIDEINIFPFDKIKYEIKSVLSFNDHAQSLLVTGKNTEKIDKIINNKTYFQ